MKKILVPSDLSKLSEKALSLANDLVQKTKGQIHLVSFIKHPFGKTFTATGEIKEKYADEENIYTLELLKKSFNTLREMSSNYADAQIHYEVYDEDFDDGVIKYINDKNIDLVVMGTTGEENAKEVFTGNHAQQVIEAAPCPVLTVREKDTVGNLSKLVLGVDFDKDSHDNFLKAVSHINELANDLGAEVYLLHVIDKGDSRDKAEEKLQTFAKDYGLSNYQTTIIEGDDEEKELIAYGHKINAGAVAVLTHADGGFFRVFENNTSEELNKQSDIPVLTVNLHKV
ncbi:MAG: universal stress protein [Fulvivirga sp.]|nr:universal stress protein [Fulvivirga sp.]